MPTFYNCDRCPAFCCSYPRIGVREADVRRLAKHFGISPETAGRKFTRKGEDPGERILRHQPDAVYGSVCQFLDLETRRCTVYAARPEVCRAYPGAIRCGYYDFLSFERRVQEDPDHVPDTFHPPGSSR